MELVTPCAEYIDSYRALIREFADSGERLVPHSLSMANQPMQEFLDLLAANSRGERLPEGFVPASMYWLIEDGEVVGVSDLRHRLTDHLRREGGNIGYGIRPSRRGRGLATMLLAQTLVKARELGLTEALVTCAKTNIASARTITRNGGVFLSEEYIEQRGEIVQRYRIDLQCALCNPGVVLAQNELAYVAAETQALSRGHVIVCPKRHVADFFDMTAEEQAAVLDLLREAQARIRGKHSPDGFNIGANIGKAAGQNRMHVHVHLIPRYAGDVQDPAGGVRCVLTANRSE